MTWYNCNNGEKTTPPPWVSRKFPWPALSLPNGFVQVMDENGKPSTFCVKAFTVETDQPIQCPGGVRSRSGKRGRCDPGTGR